MKVSAEFVEGFGSGEFTVENGGTFSFRKQTLVPQMLLDVDKLVIYGTNNKPTIRSKLSITPAPTGFKVNREHDIFECTIRDVDASHGDELTTINSEELGTNTDFEFYDRDVSGIGQRNVLGERSRLTATPPPEPIAQFLLEGIVL